MVRIQSTWGANCVCHRARRPWSVLMGWCERGMVGLDESASNILTVRMNPTSSEYVDVPYTEP